MVLDWRKFAELAGEVCQAIEAAEFAAHAIGQCRVVARIGLLEVERCDGRPCATGRSD